MLASTGLAMGLLLGRAKVAFAQDRLREKRF